MRKFLLALIFILPFFILHAQKKLDNNWMFYNVGLGYTDGTMQYFEGYNHNILYSNARAGLPLYSDWNLYSQLTTFPSYFQMGGWAQIADTSKRLRMRFGLTYFNRSDTMLYTSALGTNEMIFGRGATEETNFIGFQFGLFKTTRRILKGVYLYGGADSELGILINSKIEFFEYSYDTQKGMVVEENHFPVKGRLRTSPIVSALIGLELRPYKWIGIIAEARSGVGGSWVINEGFFGISRTNLSLGLSLYPAFL